MSKKKQETWDRKIRREPLIHIRGGYAIPWSSVDYLEDSIGGLCIYTLGGRTLFAEELTIKSLLEFLEKAAER